MSAGDAASEQPDPGTFVVAYDKAGRVVIALSDEACHALECGGQVEVDVMTACAVPQTIAIIYATPRLIEPGREGP